MTIVNTELKKVVSRVKEAQSQLQSLLKNQDWLDEARKYAEKQSKEVKKLLSGDVSTVKSFLEKERKELEKIQKQIPGEVKKLRKFVSLQRKEFEKLLANVRKASGAKKKNSGTKAKAASSKKKAAPAPTASESASTSASVQA